MNAIYNEIDPFAASWLEQLAQGGHIAHGAVDRRSIADLQPADVAGTGQRHFFAGIGGWSYALRLAGVSDDADVWTGSCPCQPFSDAGKGGGVLDPRHLWPAWFDLIRQCRPAALFGEQVASRAGLAWFDLVRSDLERCGYAVGASDLCAAGVGAPHLRQRLYFVAYARGERCEGKRLRLQPGQPRSTSSETGRGSKARHGGAQQFGNSSSSRGGRHSGSVCDEEAQGESQGREPRRVGDGPVDAGTVDGMRGQVDWLNAEYLPCTDGVSRPAEPGTFPLAHGVPARVGRLRGYGNAIVPQVAAAFIDAAFAAIEEGRLKR